MSDSSEEKTSNLSPSQGRRVDQVCDRFEQAWKKGERPRLEDFLAECEGGERDTLLFELMAVELFHRRRLGEKPAIEEYRERFPQANAARLTAILTDADESANPATANFTGAPGEEPKARPRKVSYFGDYELLKEIGQGGMGVIYRARQVSLNRIVALKMIRTGEFASGAEVQRFHQEAEASANLDHPNIVPIYEVGEHAGQHYFAMKLVEGGSLAQRREEWCLNADLSRIELKQRQREIARLMATAARAVHHAHQRSILHRDLKPANILLDAQKQPHITDFGLAKKVEGDSALTQTGAIIGTPSYMAPEQASGAKVLTTHADVYGLGAVLYELLTGRPPFKADNVLDTLLQVRQQDPPRPSATIPSMDGDLQTVCLKCLEKDPTRRYGSAEALADELERWLKDEPVHARRPSPGYRFRKFARRNRGALLVTSVLAVAMFVAIAGLAGSVGWVARDRSTRLAVTAQQVEEAIRESEALYRKDRISDAISAAERARGLLESGGGSAALHQRVRDWLTDLKMADRLEEIKLKEAAVNKGAFDHEAAEAEYAGAFLEYGLNLETLDITESASRIRERIVGPQLAAGLEEWARTRQGSPANSKPTWQQLLMLARDADPDPWRGRLRDAVLKRDLPAVIRLAESGTAREMPPSVVATLGRTLRRGGGARHATRLLVEAQRQSPGDFWLNHELARNLAAIQPPQLDEAIGFFRVAVALRPHSPGVWLNLGVALRDAHKLEEAEIACREAIRLSSEYAEAHNDLGTVCWEQKRLDDAIASFRESIRCKPTLVQPYNNLGAALDANGLHEEAIVILRQAIKIDPNHASAHFNLGLALKAAGRTDEAITAYESTVRLTPFPQAYCNLGQALLSQGRFTEALVALRRGHELGSRNPKWPYASAQWVRECERLIELEQQVPAILHKGTDGTDAAKLMELGNVCLLKRWYSSAATFFNRAFKSDSALIADPALNHRYNAACASALAGCGKGRDTVRVEDSMRTSLRQQSLDWLRADLAEWQRQLDKEPEKLKVVVDRKMQHWQQDEDLAGVRGTALSRLPAEEQAAWLDLWHHVESLRQRAGKKD